MSVIDTVTEAAEKLRPEDIQAMAKAFRHVDWAGIQHQFTKFDRHQAFVEGAQIAELVALGFPPAQYVKTALVVADFLLESGILDNVHSATVEELEISHSLPDGH